MEQLITQLWECPACQTTCEAEDDARHHCPVFTFWECGSGECEHLTESEAGECKQAKGKLKR